MSAMRCRDSAQYRDAKKLRDAGFTSYRSHYPQAPAFMDACDELGILAIVSNPGWQFNGRQTIQTASLSGCAGDGPSRPQSSLGRDLGSALNESDNGSRRARRCTGSCMRSIPGDPCYAAGDRTCGRSGGFTDWDIELFGTTADRRPLWMREWGDQVDNWSDQQSSSRVPRGWGETPMLVQAWLTWPHGPHLVEQGPAGRNGAGLRCGPVGGHRLLSRLPLPAILRRRPGFVPAAQVRLLRVSEPTAGGTAGPGVDSGPMVFIANFATFLSPSTVTVFSNCEQVRVSQNGRDRHAEAG